MSYCDDVESRASKGERKMMAVFLTVLSIFAVTVGLALRGAWCLFKHLG